MTDKEKTLAFIEERIKWNEDMMQRDPKPSDIGRIEEAKCIRRFIESLQEEPVSEELAKAAKENAKIEMSDDTEVGYDINRFGGFVDGANWQKQQMMAKAIDVTVHIDTGGYPYIPQLELYDYDKDIPLAKEGDKYKVVLIKEE